MTQLTSSSYPSGFVPPIASDIHKILASHPNCSTPYLRDFTNTDLPKLRCLHREWFPLEYSQGFYRKLQNGESKCILACIRINDESHIVGAIVFQMRSSINLVNGKKWYEDIFYQTQDSLYIMTLGVIDQYRRRGVAGKLLSAVVDKAKADQSIRLVWLHVVHYNEPAIAFYFKNQMKVMAYVPDYYTILNRPYDAKILGLCLHGAAPKSSWTQWITAVLSNLKHYCQSNTL